MGLSILFGSGADTDYCSKLPSGASFHEALLTNQFSKEREELLEELLKGKKSSHYQLVQWNSTKVFLQTIDENADRAKDAFCSHIIEFCKKYYHKEQPENESNEQQENEKKAYIKNFCRYCYYILMDNKKKREGCFKGICPCPDCEKSNICCDCDKGFNPQKIKEFFLGHAVFFDTLDEKFNSLRNSELDNRAKRVANAYATVFVLMMKTLYDFEDDFLWTYEKVFEKLAKKSDAFSCGETKKTYYSIVAESGLDCHIITTNYTDLAEDRIGKRVIYLHGKLTWFEDLKHLTVYDIKKRAEKKLALENQEHLIPFILIPSGVKPLICSKQIEQFAQFINDLNDSDELYVIGYRFNSEDNHVNSIIADWLRKKGERLVYFNYDDGNDTDNKVNIQELDWLDDDQKKKIKVIPITKNDACEEFEKYINEKVKKCGSKTGGKVK